MTNRDKQRENKQSGAKIRDIQRCEEKKSKGRKGKLKNRESKPRKDKQNK